jgi:hypothetical protein
VFVFGHNRPPGSSVNLFVSGSYKPPTVHVPFFKLPRAIGVIRCSRSSNLTWIGFEPRALLSVSELLHVFASIVLTMMEGSCGSPRHSFMTLSNAIATSHSESVIWPAMYSSMLQGF